MDMLIEHILEKADSIQVLLQNNVDKFIEFDVKKLQSEGLNIFS